MKEYLSLLKEILDTGVKSDDRTGVGTRSLFGHQYRVDLSKGFPLLTTKKVHLKSIITELMWFMRGRSDVKFLQDNNCKIWDEWSTKEQCAKFGREEGDLGPIYGHQWRNFGGKQWKKLEDGRMSKDASGFDQINWLVNEIRKNPNSRRLIVTGWNPKEAGTVCLPPCHTLWQAYVREGKVSIKLHQRSADFFLGVPFNLASYALITHLIAHACDLEVGEFIHSFGDLHIYNNHVEQVTEQLSREIRELPTIKLNDRLKGKGLETLVSFSHSDIEIINYNPHNEIKAEVAV